MKVREIIDNRGSYQRYKDIQNSRRNTMDTRLTVQEPKLLSELLDVREMAKLSGVSITTIRNYGKDGSIRTKTMFGVVTYYREDLQKVLDIYRKNKSQRAYLGAVSKKKNMEVFKIDFQAKSAQLTRLRDAVEIVKSRTDRDLTILMAKLDELSKA